MNGGAVDNGGEGKKEGFTNDEIFRLVAEVETTIKGLKESIDSAIERSRTSDKNFEGRLEGVEGAIKSINAKIHEDAQKLTGAIDKCYRAVEEVTELKEELTSLRADLKETTTRMQENIEILAKINQIFERDLLSDKPPESRQT